MGNQKPERKRGVTDAYATDHSTTSGRHARQTGGSNARDIQKRREHKPYRVDEGLNLTPPPNYEFLRFGKGTRLLEEARKLSQNANIPTYLIKEKPRNMQNEVTLQLARVGVHVRRDMVEQAAENLDLVKYKNEYVNASEVRMEKSLRAAIQNGTVNEETFNHQKLLYQAKNSIRELYPNIDEASCDTIAKHSWAKNDDGTPRIGLAEDIPLEKRVQLAVSAHIRHVYTDYDALLKAFGWHLAREMQAEECLVKMKQWMGDDFDDTTQAALKDLMKGDSYNGVTGAEYDGQAQNTYDFARPQASTRPAAVSEHARQDYDSHLPSSHHAAAARSDTNPRLPTYTYENRPYYGHEHAPQQQPMQPAYYPHERLPFGERIYQSIEPEHRGALAPSQPMRYPREEPRPAPHAEYRPMYIPLTYPERPPSPRPTQYHPGVAQTEQGRTQVHEDYHRVHEAPIAAMRFQPREVFEAPGPPRYQYEYRPSQDAHDAYRPQATFYAPSEAPYSTRTPPQTHAFLPYPRVQALSYPRGHLGQTDAGFAPAPVLSPPRIYLQKIPDPEMVPLLGPRVHAANNLVDGGPAPVQRYSRG
ncbi:hypothetical protein MBLNU230_g1161t1 [Neophaeotheca triangularis]